MPYKMAEDLELPDEAAKWTIADLAIKGAGKTWAAAVFAEELVRNDKPILVVDPLGLWWSLRVGVDGEGNPDPNVQGLPVVIFGGRHGDMTLPITTQVKGKREWQALDESKLKVMVKSILESGISAVLDVSGLSQNLKRRIVAQFVNEVMRQYETMGGYGVRHIFLEEAAEFAPQRLFADDESHNSLGAIGKLVREGGNFNIGCTLISQRPAVLNKDCLTQCSCLFVLRILHKLDKDAVKTWVESMADPKDKAIVKWYDGLKELKNGEGWVWSPESKIFQQVHFAKRTTLHATREYFERAGKTPLKLQEIGDYLGKYKKIFTPPPVARAPPAPIRNFTNIQDAPERYMPAAAGDTHPQEPRPEIEVTKDVVDFNVLRDQLIAVLNELEPRTCFGRLLVVLKQGTDNAGNRKWTLSSIHEALEQHGWPHSDQEIKEAIEQLLRTEHLERVAAGSRGFDYRFKGANRVRIIPRIRELPVPAIFIILGALLLAWYLHLPL